MSETLRWTPTLFEAQSGAFSSSKRYIRAVGSSGFAMTTGKTCTGNYVFISDNNQATVFHFNIPGVLERSYINFGSGNFDPGQPTPVVQAITA